MTLALLITAVTGAWAQSTEPTEWDLTSQDGKVWTLAEMPASDIELQVEYYPAATATNAPTAATGDIYAGDATALISAGTTTEGTMMYAVGTSSTEAPALTAFTATVPTAAALTAAGTAYVWYYIAGDDTHSDSEIVVTPINVTVKNNKFNVTFSPAPVDKVDVTVGSAAATPNEEGKLTGVKMGSEVKLKAKTGYKFRKVEAKKVATE